ncbi:uncharacterized protein LOC114724752 [Neltuma alba]|uniref:uncharacterized protein LOC114724752 n=1 Tax=Neltuma alba TaxID=207710 RepID=UPI0010A4D912|nr:uncharacterized protein LOC114724752 [Prosopis alba]
MEAVEAKLSDRDGCCIDVPAPLVQELVKQPLNNVPERYVLPELEIHFASSTSSPLQQAPAIVMTKLFSPDFHVSELHKLDLACKHWGFFQVINHGVRPSLVENVKKGVEEFFNLPMEEKTKFQKKVGEREGYGQLFVVSEEQKLDWADMLYFTTLPLEERKSHLFPNLPLPFRDNLDAYCMELANLAIELIRLMGEALNIEAKGLRELFEGALQSVRMNYYPACPQPEKVIGLYPHSDATALTILLQVNEMDGFQVKRDGSWVPIKPLPHTFVVNLGDTFEIVSNGIYKSVEHRAIVNSKKERMSVATFFGARLDGVIGPSPNIVSPERPPLFKTISMSDFWSALFKHHHRGKSYLDYLRIPNHTHETTSGDCINVPVPLVQELAKQPLTIVPERYVRPELELQLKSNTSALPQAPVIDLTKLLSPEFHVSELHKLDYACKHWGFFQLINHGVSPSLVESVKKGVEEFFNLPIEEKTKFQNKAGEREGYGQLFVVSEEQELDWADMLFLTTLPREARKPHLFPNLPLPFRDNLDTYCIELRKLVMELIILMGEALNMEVKEVRELFEGGLQTVRMNYYPACPQPEKAIGLYPHSDGSALTMLLQVNEVDGLEIKKDGTWIPINPVPDAFVVNIGDTFEIVSNGIYKSVEHRATVNSKKERMSTATFFGARLDGMLGPSPNLVTPERPPQFKTISVSDYWKAYFSRQLHGKSHLDSLRIANQTHETT